MDFFICFVTTSALAIMGWKFVKGLWGSQNFSCLPSKIPCAKFIWQNWAGDFLPGTNSQKSREAGLMMAKTCQDFIDESCLLFFQTWWNNKNRTISIKWPFKSPSDIMHIRPAWHAEATQKYVKMGKGRVQKRLEKRRLSQDLQISMVPGRELGIKGDSVFSSLHFIFSEFFFCFEKWRRRKEGGQRAKGLSLCYSQGDSKCNWKIENCPTKKYARCGT